MAFKMKGHALPGIKQAFKKYKSDAQRKAVHASKADAAMKKTSAKPDYIDIDGDGNTTESMKSASSSMKMYGKKSPMKNYKNPKDYKVFNMGNEASPSFKKHKKKGY